MRSLFPIACVAAGLGAACTPAPPGVEPTKAEPTKAEPTKAEPEKREWPADTPSAMACTTHEDCVVVPTAPGEDPCCDFTVTIGPRARKYLAFVEAYRKDHCAGVQCPPNALPGAQPSPCALEGRCLEGQCNIACADPEYMKTWGEPPAP